MQWYDLDAVNQQNPLAHINYLEAELIAQTVQTKQFDVGKKAGSCTELPTSTIARLAYNT